MAIHITGAPCCWGVDDVKNPYLPKWQTVLDEAGKAGFRAIELGPYGYLPLDIDLVSAELKKNGISIVAGTIFDDLVAAENRENLLRQVDDICGIITKLPIAEKAATWGVRAVIHPHAGGYIEFADEIDRLAEDIPDEVAGLCLDTGHLRYSGMDPVEWLRKYADRLDYIHFKDINEKVYNEVLAEHIRFFEGCGKGAMCPIGTGMLDYPAIYKLLTEELHYAGYITVEQERDPRNVATSLRDVKASVDYLHGLGFE